MNWPRLVYSRVYHSLFLGSSGAPFAAVGDRLEVRAPAPGLGAHGPARTVRPGGGAGISAGRGALCPGGQGGGTAQERRAQPYVEEEPVFVFLTEQVPLILTGGLRSLIGQSKPDCYAVASVGADEGRTQVKKDECDPVWEDEPW